MNRPRTVQNESISPLVRALDLGVGALRSLGLPMTKLTEEAILSRAMQHTGLSDFGNPKFREPMAKVLALLRAEPGLTNMTYVQFNHAMTQAAENRLRLEQYKKDYPEVTSIEVKRPVFVLGFPRTGTTVLQNLLSCGEHRRGLEFWELIDPIPHSKDTQADMRKRIRSAQHKLDIAYRVAPEMEVVHYMNAVGSFVGG